MWTSYSPGRSDEPNLLPARNRISLCDESATQMEVAGDDAVAVVDVHDIAGEKEIIHQCNHTSIRGAYGRADFSREVHAEVPACKSAIEGSSRSEAGSDRRRSRSDE